MTSKNQGTET